VLDIRPEVSRQELFHIIADNLAGEVDLPRERLYEMLEQREAIGSTVVRPGLAIPHLIIEEAQQMRVILIRSRPGVIFAEGQPPVQCMFMIAASPADRNLYLKALIAIAEIAQEPGFDEKWMAARNTESLRELVLAAERRRERSRQ